MPGSNIEWLDEIHDVDSWSAGLLQPYDDVPEFSNDADPEVDVNIRLIGDRSFTRKPSRRLFHDYRANPDAYKHLEHLPTEGESLHGVISGKYALYELIPALIEKKGTIDDLHVATLSFNKANAHDMLLLLDEGHVKKVSLLISYYFKSTSRPIYDLLVPPLRDRGHKVLAMRTHVKLLLARMASGERYIIETSANLRSSQNIEQFVMTRDDDLYNFHHGWMEDELLHGKELGEKEEAN